MAEYLLSQRDAPALERARLELLEAYYDPVSERQFDAIGVGEGWRCLDVGAGGGSVTRMLAERVGATGSVLAVDLDTSLLDGLASERIEVRHVDLRADSLPAEAFDLVHTRMLLMHLPARLAALRRLAAAVRPGGWVAAIEPDFNTVAVSPPTQAWERTWSAFYDALIAGGWDPGYGARLGAALRAAGFVEVRAEHIAECEAGGSNGPRLLALTLERLRERMLALGADSDGIDESQRLLADPGTMLDPPTSCVVRARRP